MGEAAARRVLGTSQSAVVLLFPECAGAATGQFHPDVAVGRASSSQEQYTKHVCVCRQRRLSFDAEGAAL